MSKESLVVVLGLVVFFIPSLGIPEDWKEYGLLGAGLLLIVVGFFLRRASYLRKIDRGNGERGSESFLESNPNTAENDTEFKEEETV